MTYIDIIDLWPTAAALAADTGRELYAVLKWRQRKRIPVEAWPALLKTKIAKRHDITASVLLRADAEVLSERAERIS